MEGNRKKHLKKEQNLKFSAFLGGGLLRGGFLLGDPVYMFFAISFHIRSNTYSKVMILYPKGNLMLLNTFLTFFW